MKKALVITFSIVFAGIVVIGYFYGVDKYKMENNQPIVFSTWGRTYAPPVEEKAEPPVLKLVDTTGGVRAICLTSTHSWSEGGVCVHSDYPHPVAREYMEENVLRIGGVEKISIDNTKAKIKNVYLYRLGDTSALKYDMLYNENSVFVDTPNGEEYILEIRVDYDEGAVSYCVKVMEQNDN